MKLYPNITIYFIVWFLCLIFIAYFGFLTLPHSESFDNNFFESFSNWDGGHFLGIAQYGYTEKFQYAFFPLYPILINFLAKFTNNYLSSALLISIISAYLGLHFLYKIISRSFDKKIAGRGVLALLFFPTSFYFLTAYSEGLFFLLAVLTFYFLQSKSFFWAAVFASFAAATRLSGLALVLTLAVAIYTLDVKNKYLYILLSFLGFFGYCFFLYKQVGDPFYFTVAELHWQRSFSIPGLSFWDSLKSLTGQGLLNIHPNVLLDFLFAVFGLGLAMRSVRFLPPMYFTYAILSVGIPLFTPSLSSMPRFLLPILPIFILIALLKNKYIVLIYQIISLLLLSLFVVLFTGGYWVS